LNIVSYSLIGKLFVAEGFRAKLVANKPTDPVKTFKPTEDFKNTQINEF
jgi:hypothetical protein